MTRLTDYQRAVLEAAADQDDVLTPAMTAERKFPKRVLTSLIKRGLIEEVPTAAAEQTEGTEGRTNFCLRITEAGRAAIEPAPDAKKAPETEGQQTDTKPSTKQDAVLKLLGRENGQASTR